MDVLYNILTWVINLACIYVAYLAVREVEKTLVRRSFSLLLTLVLVIVSYALLISGVGLVSNVFLQFLRSSYYTSFGDEWIPVIGAILALGIVALIWRDVASRLHGETCPQCGTPLQGNVVCPQCGWGGLSLPDSMAGLAKQAAARVSSVQNRPSPRSTPMVTEIPPAPTPAPTSAPGTVCAQCGTSNVADDSFCAKCGAALT